MSVHRKDGCGHLQAIEYEIVLSGGRDAFSKQGDPNDPYRLWDGDQVKTDWGYRNNFRYMVEVTFSGAGIQTSTYQLWEMINNWGQWTWRTIAPKTVVEPISTGAVSLTVIVRLRLLTGDRVNMQGVTDDTDVYVVVEDEYEIKD